MRIGFFKATLLLMIVGWLGFSQAYARPIVLAQVSDRPKKDFKQLRPMAAEVAKRLSQYGITEGQVRLYPNVEELTLAMQRGEVDWVTETLYSAAVLVAEANAKPLVQKWKGGDQEYRSFLFTRRDSALNNLNDLVGRSVAFEHPASFSSYYLPRHLFDSQGMTTRYLESIRAHRHPGMVNFLFSRNEKNNVLWVEKGLVDAGVISEADWNDEVRVSAQQRQMFKVIHRSEFYPRALELVSPNLDAQVAEGLRSVLLEMSPVADSDVMARYERTTGFSKISDNLYRQLEEIYQHQKAWGVN